MEMMDNMDDEQLEQMAKMQQSMNPSMPKMDAKAMRSAFNQVKDMDPAALKSMSDMAAKMGMGPGGSGMDPSKMDPAKA